jgi:hypothetical protein
VLALGHAFAARSPHDAHQRNAELFVVDIAERDSPRSYLPSLAWTGAQPA